MNTKELKATMLLSLAFFMVRAPNPDAEAITEMTAGFIVTSNDLRLQADELPLPPEMELNDGERSEAITLIVD